MLSLYLWLCQNLVNRIVIAPETLVAALRSSRSAAHHLMTLAGTGQFELALSMPLVIEYETEVKKAASAAGTALNITDEALQTVIDYLCSIAEQRIIFHPWHPRLGDLKDDVVLDIAANANCNLIVTEHPREYAGAEWFGIKVVTAAQFLKEMGVPHEQQSQPQPNFTGITR